MKRKGGFNLAISTLVILVLAVVVMIALILSFTGGWKRFITTTESYSGSDIDNLNKICQSHCDFKNTYSFCCDEWDIEFNKEIGKEKVTCEDERLKVDCNIDCEGVCSENSE